MILRIALVLALSPLLDTAAPRAQTPRSKPARPAELVLQGKIREAVRLAGRSAGSFNDTLKELLDQADMLVTDRRIGEARDALAATEKFVDAFEKARRGRKVPRDGLRGRQLRVEGIQLSDNREYDKAIPVLNEALQTSRRAKDGALEAGIRNNIGYALNAMGQHEKAAAEFTAARDLAEKQGDSLRAGSYNFNLGLAQFQLRRWDPALDAFRRSAEQSRSASRPNIEAIATLYQGRTLSHINPVSPEAMKHFVAAQKMFEAQGDHRHSGLSFYLMADHVAYSLDFTRAAYLGEQAIAPYSRAGDVNGLLAAYNLLADMYGRLGKKEKAEEYRKKAKEVAAKKAP